MPSKSFESVMRYLPSKRKKRNLFAVYNFYGKCLIVVIFSRIKAKTSENGSGFVKFLKFKVIDKFRFHKFLKSFKDIETIFGICLCYVIRELK